MKHDYIERSDAGFNGWQQNFMQAATPNINTWGISPANWATLKSLQNNWQTAYAAGGKGSLNTRNKQMVQTKNDARLVYEAALRQFVKQWIKYNTLITDDQRISLGVTVHKTRATPIQVPDTAPEIHFATASGSQLIVSFNQMPQAITSLPDQRSSKRRGKPKGYRSVRLYYVLGNTPPADISGCNRYTGLTRHGQRLKFTPADAGKKLYVYACWVNTKEQEGPLTQMQTVVIPS